MIEYLYIGNLIFFLVFLLIYFRINKLTVYNPISYYLTFHFIVFVFRPLIVYYDNLNFVYAVYHFAPSDADKTWAIIAANVGLLSFVVCAHLAGANRPFQFRPMPNEELQAKGERGLKGAIAALCVLLPLIIFSMEESVRIFAAAPDLSTIISDSETMYTSYADSNGYIVDANIMLGILGIIMFWTSRYKLIYLIPVFIFVFYRTYIGAARWTFVMVSITAILILLYDQRRYWLKPAHIGAAMALLMLFAAIQQRDLIRTTFFGETALVAYDDGLKSQNYFDTLDLANLEFIEYIVSAVPEKSNTYDYFLNTLEVLVAPIPRSLWPGKPYGAPFKMVDFYQFGYPIGMTYSLPGQGWLGFGLTGVILWCGAAGVLMGKFYAWFVGGPQSRYKIGAYMTYLPMTLLWYRDGILITAIKFPMFPMLAIFAWYLCDKLPGLLSSRRRTPVHFVRNQSWSRITKHEDR